MYESFRNKVIIIFILKKMDLRKLKEVTRHAEYYHILSRYERTGEFDYTVYFNEEDSFSNGHKAMLFIDALVEREKKIY